MTKNRTSAEKWGKRWEAVKDWFWELFHDPFFMGMLIWLIAVALFSSCCAMVEMKGAEMERAEKSAIVQCRVENDYGEPDYVEVIE